jgi:hypothetical protein
MTDLSGHDERRPDVPGRLADDLARLQHTPVVPPAVDMAILASAQLKLHRQVRSRRLVRWAGGAVAAAAVLVAAVFLSPPAQQPAAMREARIPARPTILDAFNLARQLERGPVHDPRLDINHDGTIDRKDVDALASAAVQLKGGSV